MNWKKGIAFKSKKKNHMGIEKKEGSLSWKTNVLFSASISGDKSPAPGLSQNGELHISLKALQICIDLKSSNFFFQILTFIRSSEPYQKNNVDTEKAILIVIH